LTVFNINETRVTEHSRTKHEWNIGLHFSFTNSGPKIENSFVFNVESGRDLIHQAIKPANDLFQYQQSLEKQTGQKKITCSYTEIPQGEIPVLSGYIRLTGHNYIFKIKEKITITLIINDQCITKTVTLEQLGINNMDSVIQH